MKTLRKTLMTLLALSCLHVGKVVEIYHLSPNVFQRHFSERLSRHGSGKMQCDALSFPIGNVVHYSAYNFVFSEIVAVFRVFIRPKLLIKPERGTWVHFIIVF